MDSSDSLPRQAFGDLSNLSGPTQLYKELSDLQTDLSKTVAVCHRLKAENDALHHDKEKARTVSLTFHTSHELALNAVKRRTHESP